MKAPREDKKTKHARPPKLIDDDGRTFQDRNDWPEAIRNFVYKRFGERDLQPALRKLAQLVEQPLARLEQKKDAWRWRDWELQPVEQGKRWRLHRGAAGSKQSG